MEEVYEHDESFNQPDNVESLTEEPTISFQDNDERTMAENTPTEEEVEELQFPNTDDEEEGEGSANNMKEEDFEDVIKSESDETDERDVDDSPTIIGSDEGQIISPVHPVQVEHITSGNQAQFEASDRGSQNDISSSNDINEHTEQLDQEYADSESLISKCEDVEENDDDNDEDGAETTPPPPVSKSSVVSLGRKESDGTSFWSNSARNSVVSLKDNGHDSKEPVVDPNEVVDTDSPRRILQKKRSSLSHKPDIVRVFEKKSIQQSGDVHEFQKVEMLLFFFPPLIFHDIFFR